ncbi:hypothetical protein Daura_31590 [Dactylosporangium aurantiacum]|uniref:Uncharacterized protein n=1 Tax=Dactylosporangium aurantiacum TaxID=35754 RepID=A0A9Q9I8G0_9ACTN|nr:hypothetical protein [Dactylosporangium aurantiacum]MDG6109557.1 hypothetical protein [Dactylosporangium aurantiacum]UWZ51287.1 hypothetical protein Daura_31590 [Dactylosporangium aurantiacum]
MCHFQPAPGQGAPPPCWLLAATHRRRLDLAVANLRHYGIIVVPAWGEDADRARLAISALARRQCPDGLGSYVFWTAHADQGFDAGGTLHSDLELHHSPDAADAVAAALHLAGLPHQPGRDRDSTTIHP